MVYDRLDSAYHSGLNYKYDTCTYDPLVNSLVITIEVSLWRQNSL